MKLHLPLSLRTCLLTCMAAVTGLVPTVATGSLFAGYVVIAASVASQVSAEWAPADITYSGNIAINAADVSNPQTVTENSTLTYQREAESTEIEFTIGSITATEHDIKLVSPTADAHMNANAAIIAANSVWFSQGRYLVSATSVANAGTLYAQGGQMFVNMGQTIANTVFLGSSTYTETYNDNGDIKTNTALSNVSLRLDDTATLSGTVTLVEDAAISVYTGSASITGKIDTAGHTLEKKGAGVITITLGTTSSLDGLAISGGTFRSSYSADNGKLALGSLDVKASSTLQHHSWNALWTIGDLKSSVASEGLILTLDNSGSHWFRTQFAFQGTGAIDNGSLFGGTIDVKHTGSSNNGTWLIEMYAGTATQLSKTLVNLNDHAILAVTADHVELRGLTSTNANAYVFSGANTDTTTHIDGNNNNLTPFYVQDGQIRTLTLSGTGDFSFLGTIAGNLTIDKMGLGKQTFGNLGDNVTINLKAGSLAVMGTVGTGTSIVTEVGTTVEIPWTLTADGDVTTASYTDPTYISGEGKILRGDLAATGNTADVTNDSKYTVIDATGYTGNDVTIISGLVSIFKKGTSLAPEMADFGTIETLILNGGGILTNAINSNDTFTFDKNLVIQGNGYFRSYGNESVGSTTILTGTISGSGTFTKTDGGKVVLQGDMSGFTGSIVVGSGWLTFNTDATIGSLALHNTGVVGVSGGHHVVDSQATHNPTNNQVNTIILDGASDFLFNSIMATSGQNNKKTTIEIQKKEGMELGGSVTTSHLTLAKDFKSTCIVNIGAGTALNITGSDVVSTQGDFITNNALTINHWGYASIVVNGTLNMLNSSSIAMVDPQSASTLTIEDGGVLNMLGISAKWRDGAKSNNLSVMLKEGSMLNLGAEGMRADSNTGNNIIRPVDLQLQGGSLGILASTTSWSGAWALTLTADTVVNTQLYTAATDGSAGSYADVGGTITLSGAITGDGKLIKQGLGTLVLTNVGKLEVQQGFVGANGALNVGTLTTMTEGGGRFLLDLDTNDNVLATSYAGRLNLTLTGSTDGRFEVFHGAAGLTKEQIDFESLLARGLSATYEVNNGTVTVIVTGTAETGHHVTWAGDANEVWSNSAVEAWVQNGATTVDRFSNGDAVTFSGDGIKDITISGIVKPASITVTGSENYSFNDGVLVCAGLLTKSGDGTLTLNTDASGLSGGIELSGGMIAFRGSLGTGNIDASGTSGLSWLDGNTTDVSANLHIAAGGNFTFDVNGPGTVSMGTAIANSASYAKTGAGTLRLAAVGGLTGSMIVKEGTLTLAAGTDNNGHAAFTGDIAVKSGAKLVSATAFTTGWAENFRVSSLLLENGSEWVLEAGGLNILIGDNLHMQGAVISHVNADATLQLAANGVVTIDGTKASVINAKLQFNNGAENIGTLFHITDVDGGNGSDLIVKGDVSQGSAGDLGFTKDGAGTMEIVGKYSAGQIRVNAGILLLHNAEYSGILSVSKDAGFTVAANGTFLWDMNGEHRSLTGSITIEQGGTLRTRGLYKYHTTLDAAASLSGSGTWVTGLPTANNQHDGWRNLYVNGNTAGFTGVLEMHGTGNYNGMVDHAFRTALYLNSADSVMNGVIRLQGAVYNGGWSSKDDSVVPLMNQIILQKSMAVGGIEGLGGILKTDVAEGNRVTLTVGRDSDHIFSGSIADRIDLVKTGSGKQIFNGDLSGFDGTISIEGGTLDIGSTNYEKNLSLTGANASLVTTGHVTIGAGQTLTVTATGTVVNGALDIAGGSLNLGDMSAESHAVGLGGHSLTLSTTNKTNLSLTLADNLASGATVDLFTNVSGLLNGGTALTLNDALLEAYFNIDGIAALNNAKLQFVGGKLQIVLARGTSSLLYGQNDNGIWKDGAAFDAGGTQFTAGTNVEFGAIADADSMTVQLGGEIAAGSITIGASAGKTYHFTQQQGADPAGSITAMNGMTITSGTADFAAGTLQPGTDATIAVNGGTLSLQTGATNGHVAIALGNGSTLLWGTGNTADYSANGKLSIAKGARVTLDLNNNDVTLGFAVAGTGSYEVVHGNLTLGGNTVLTGSVSIDENHTITLNASEGNWTLNISGSGGIILPDNGGTAHLTGNNTYTGKTQVAGNGTLHVTDTSLSAATSGVELATADSKLQYTATKDATLDRVLSGAGSVSFEGTHTITLSGANTYTGTTTIAAGTTLATTVSSLATASAIVANGIWSLSAGDAAYTLVNAVSGTGGITVSGKAVTWDTTADHEKTYTGTTTLAANTTVTATGPLTTGANSKIVLADATSTLKLDLTEEPTSWTQGHTVSGAGVLALATSGATINSGGALIQNIIDSSASAPTLGTLRLLANSALEITSSEHNGLLSKITAIDVVSGAHLDLRAPTGDTARTLTIAGAGLASETAGTAKASALRFGNGSAAEFTQSRRLVLAADATVFVDNGKTGSQAGAYESGGHTLTKTGSGTLAFTNASGLDASSFAVNAGILQFKADANATFGTVGLTAGTTLSFYNKENKDNKVIVNNLSLAGDATLQTTNHSGSILVDNLTGTGHTLTIDGASYATPTQFVIVRSGTFSGVIDVRQSNSGVDRRFVFGATDGDTLSNAIVKLSQRASASGARLLAFAVGGEADGTIKIAGLEGIADATVISTNTFNRNNTTAETLADGNARTLEITGAGGTFSGSIGKKLTVDMNGTDTQTLAGALADDSHYVVTQGTLALSGANQTGSHTFRANGGTLDMSGYTRSGTSATVVDSVIAKGGTVSNLTLGNGMELKADDSYTGAVALGGTTMLAGGKLVFRLKTEESSPGYHGLETSYAVQSGGSIAIGGSAENKTILTFVPVDKRLDPGTDSDGQDYVLIANVGTAFGAAGNQVNMEASHLDLNMSTEGRTEYTLKVVEKDGKNDLVLNVSGAAATLVWKGDPGEWNTSKTNLAWTNTDDGGNADSFYEDDLVVFGTLDAAQTITVAEGGVRMGGMLVKGDTDYTFTGGAISSSEGNTEATLTVGGDGENAFTGTLTLNVANTYAGDTFIHNGTVAAENAGALSDTETHLNGGRLELNFDGTFGASALTMAGGALHAGGDAIVSSIQWTGTGSAKTLSAADGKTLALTSSTGTIEGSLTIGSATAADAATGTVSFAIGTASLSHAQNIAILSGTLELAGTTGSFTGRQVALDGGDLRLTGGLTATLSNLSGNGKAIVNASTLAFSENVDTDTQIDASNAVIDAKGALSLGNLHLVSGTTTLTGTVAVNGMTEGADTVLSVGKSGGDTGNVTLGTGVTNVGKVAVMNGSLTVKDGDTVGFLESYGALNTLADAANVSTEKILLKNGASVDAKITLTIDGAAEKPGDHSWLGDQPGGTATTVGTVIIDNAAAQVHFGAELTATQVTIKQGTLTTDYAATVTNGISLEGAGAVLNLADIDSVDAVTLKQGELRQAGAFAGTLTVADEGENTRYALGGLSNAATVDIRHLGAGSSLTGLAGLKLGTATITLTEEMNALFVMNDTAGTVSLADDGRLDVVCSGILNKILQEGEHRYTVTNGSLGGLLNADGSLKGNVVFDPTMNLYNVVAGVEGGDFTFTQLAKDNSTVYTSSKEGETIGGTTAYGVFDQFTKVNIDVNTSIDLAAADRNTADAADGLVVKNLHSLAEGTPATLTITGRAPAEGTPNDLVTLNNSLSDTWFGGNIRIDNADLQIKHSNATDKAIDPTDRELTLRGTLTTNSLVSLEDGKLTLAGNGNVLSGGLSFNDDATAGEKGQLEIGGNTELGGSINSGGGTAADMLLTNGSTVSLLHGATFDASMQGTGAETLAVRAGNSATIGENAQIEDVRLNIAENGTLAIESTGAGNLLVNGLGGKGTLNGGTDAKLGIAVHEGLTSAFSGKLEAYEGKLSVTGAGTQVLATSAKSADIAVNGGHLVLRTGGQIGDDGSNNREYKNINVTGGGTLHFDTTAYNGEGFAANNTIGIDNLTAGTLARAAGTNTLVFDFNLTNDLQGGGVLVDAGRATLTNATVQLNIKDVANDFVLIPDREMSFTLMSDIAEGSTIKPDLVHSAIIEKYFGSSAGIRLDDGGNLVFTGTTVSGDTAHFHADAATTETGRAGADLLDYYFATRNPQSTAPGSLAAGVLGALEGIIAAGDKAQADRIMSGVAGSTVTSLSASFAAGFDARMTSIRNRMTGMGVDQTLVNEDMPYFHAWISADGANTSLDADSTMAGYKLNSWGGTVGVDVDVNDFLTLGAAFTASYGDLTADGAETADGNLDTYTAALFAHAQVKRWTHDVVLAVSTADADLDRTVDYGAGNYTAKGTTNGFGFGALYELAYNIPVGEDEDGIFSPLFRASFTHVSVDGYTETKAESMGLAVGKQDISYATFGLGARYVAAIGENVFNRTATLELRAMVLQDAGSRQGEADVALGGSAGRTRTVKGAEPGSTGIQVGASLNVPVEESSAIFADVNLDARSKTTTVNGSVGYRINF